MPPSSNNVYDVWLVEDSRLFRETLSEIIDATDDLRCSHAFGSCEDAIHALQAGSLPDALLMDIGLPGMNGIDGARKIRVLAPALPVIMLTVHQDNDRIFEAICAGATGYLSKSIPGDEIVRAVRQVFSGGAAMDAQIARRVLEMFTRMTAPKADYGLSGREGEILYLLVDGLTKNEIADQLFLSPHTIDGHMRNIYAKLHVRNRTGAVAKALRENLL